MRNHITKYSDGNGNKFVTAWSQINLFGKSFCFFVRTIEL